VLRKGEQRLLPDDRRNVGRVEEGLKVVDESVDDAVGQRVLFEQHGTQKESVGGCEIHLRQLQDGHGRMEHRH
jgi:hypothetical protein